MKAAALGHDLVDAPPRKTTLARVQAASGLAFFAFASVHFVNTMLAAVSRELYDGFQSRARILYQHPIVEIALFATLFVHIATGVLSARRFPVVSSSGEGRDGGEQPSHRWHRYAGRALAIVILGHVAATRGPSLLAGVHPGFIGIAYTIMKWPAVSYPYFAALIACGIFHGGYGAWKAVGTLQGKGEAAPLPKSPFAGRAILVVALVLAVGLSWLGILGLGGRLYAIEDPGRSRFAVLVEGLLSHSEK